MRNINIDFSNMSAGKNNAFPRHALEENQCADTLNAIHEKIGLSRAPGYAGITKDIVVIPIIPVYYSFGFDGATPKLYGSEDLVSWVELGALPVGAERVVGGNGTLVCKAGSLSHPGSDSVFYSTDLGATWTESAFPTGYPTINGLDYVNGVFYSYNTGNEVYDKIYSSTDGITWTLSDALSTSSSGQASVKFSYGNGKYSFVVSNETTAYYGELNAGAWTSTAITLEASETYTHDGLVISDQTVCILPSGRVVIVDKEVRTAEGGPYTEYAVYVSREGDFSHFDVLQIYPGSYYYHVFYDGTNLIITDDEVSQSIVEVYNTTTLAQITSYNGAAVIGTPILANDEWWSYCINDLNMAHVPVDDKSKIYSSTNLAPPIWGTESTGIPGSVEIKQLLGPSTISPPPSPPSYFTFGLNGSSTPVLYGSPDLGAWTAATVPAGTGRVVFGNGILVAFIGTDSVSASSDFGVSWGGVQNLGPYVQGIDFVNGKFYAFIGYYGTPNKIASSVNGVDWVYTDELSTIYPSTAKFFLFKGKVCCIASTDHYGDRYSHFGELNGTTWTVTQLSFESLLVTRLLPTDDTITMSADFIVALSDYNGTGLRSSDGINWEMLVESHMVSIYHIGSNFWAKLDIGGLSVAYDDTTGVQGVVVAGFLEGYKQVIDDTTKVFAIKSTEEYRVYQSPIPPATPAWSTESTGIPTTVQLKQLLG